MLMVLGVAVLALGSVAASDSAAPLSVVMESAPGDTLNYRASWGAAQAATGYRFVVRELWNPAGTFTGLPNNTITLTPSVLFSAISLTADSARFRAVVWSRRGAEEHRDSVFVEWTVRRRLGPPGPIVIDSSLVLTEIEVRPGSAATMTVVSGTRLEMCVYSSFYDGKRVLSDGDAARCDGSRWYTPDQLQLSPAQAARADSICIRYEATGGVLSATSTCRHGPVTLEHQATATTGRNPGYRYTAWHGTPVT